jgi:hypothetical protein
MASYSPDWLLQLTDCVAASQVCTSVCHSKEKDHCFSRLVDESESVKIG